jgi:hypothetical protein
MANRFQGMNHQVSKDTKLEQNISPFVFFVPSWFFPASNENYFEWSTVALLPPSAYYAAEPMRRIDVAN